MQRIRFSITGILLATLLLGGCSREDGPADALPNSLFSGVFADRGGQETAGAYRIVVEGEDLKLFLSHDFRTDEGPDLHVLLSPTETAVADNDNALVAGSFTAGLLGAFEGSQVFDLPDTLDLSRFNSVMIHCLKYTHIFGAAPIHHAGREVIGYYPAWRYPEAPERLNPAMIPFGKLSALMYCFFYPTEAGELEGVRPEADRLLLVNGASGTSEQTIVELAHEQGARAILSIGGWEHSDNFPAVSADPVKRTRFAAECGRVLSEYGFDGIDIDWEFPGYANHKGTPQDKFNFTLLLASVRDTLDLLGMSTGRHFTLSASLPAAAGHLPDIQVERILPLLDYINIMTWDLFGTWGQISNHNSALYSPAQGDSARCLDGAFRLYHEAHGVPRDRINLGVSFSGHAYADCAEMYGSHGGSAAEHFPEGDGVNFAGLTAKISGFQRMWDSAASTSYYVNPSERILVSIDDEASVAAKVQYVHEKGARGVIIWQLMGDHTGMGQTPLLDRIASEMRTATATAD